jgi:hypothetical protein
MIQDMYTPLAGAMSGNLGAILGSAIEQQAFRFFASSK